MVTERDCPKIKVPPPIAFLVLGIIAGALEYGVGFDYSRGPTLARVLIALLLFVASGYLALHAVVVLKQGGTYVDPGKPTRQLVAEGPFQFSRNPMYLSLVIALLGLSVLFLSIWFFLSTIILGIVLDQTAVRPEEAYLEKKFGGDYTAYRKKVRKWI